MAEFCEEALPIRRPCWRRPAHPPRSIPSAARHRAGAHCQCACAATPGPICGTIWRPSWPHACRPGAGARCSTAPSKALTAAGLVEPAGRAHRGERGRRRARLRSSWASRAICRACGASCATCGWSPPRSACSASRPSASRRWHADGLRAAIVERAYGLKIKGVPRLRGCARRWQPARSSGRSAIRARPASPASWACRPRPAVCWRRSSSRQAARFRHRHAADRGAGRRACRRHQDRPGGAAPRRAARRFVGGDERQVRAAKRAGRACRPPKAAAAGGAGPRTAGAACCAPATGRPDLAGFARRCAGMRRARRKAGPATARPTSATSGAISASSGPTGGCRRSSSSACWPRRTAPGQLALANADLKDSKQHQGRAGLGRDLSRTPCSISSASTHDAAAVASTVRI